ncbi:MULTISPECIES: epipeptide YydF family RiPP [Staphylococcus]|uniref:epipeptide YydF family RiPP n=1 Tax=Staphylococcus TaxID=1279 RepID=UPI00063EBBBE|nr:MULTISPECIES: epipeptide YydF family RiPP [Staphylococcus]MDK8645407.1 epipeptide YydF family RiPP [Staphylococcus condimenti]
MKGKGDIKKNKDVQIQKKDKKDAMKNLEFKNLVNDSEKLAKVNDLWYFVKSKSHRWIVGSGH